jgi:hypothetical protein
MVAAAVLLAALGINPTVAADKPPRPIAKMEWWSVCIEHGRHLRARTHDSPRSKDIAQAARENGFTSEDIAVALNRTPRIGMNPCAAMAAFGTPDANHRSTGAWGTDEQYVYRSRRLYLHFRNQVLTSYQD